MSERGKACSADWQSAVSQDAILQDYVLAGASELRQRPADWQSATQQINNLRYAQQTPDGRGSGWAAGKIGCCFTVQKFTNKMS